MDDNNLGNSNIDFAITLKNNLFESQLANVKSVFLHSGIGEPFITGSFEYFQDISATDLSCFLDNSFVSGTINITKKHVSGHDSSVQDTSIPGASIFFDFVVTKFHIPPSSFPRNGILIRVDFVDISACSFMTTLPSFSTNNATMSVTDILNSLFTSVGLSLKRGDIGITKKIPFITSANETLSTAVPYLLRRSYDENDIQASQFISIFHDIYSNSIKLWSLNESLSRNMDIDVSSTERTVGALENRCFEVNFSPDSSNILATAANTILEFDSASDKTEAMDSFSGKKHTSFSYENSSFIRNTICSMKTFSSGAFKFSADRGAINRFSSLFKNIPSSIPSSYTGYSRATTDSRNNSFLYDDIDNTIRNGDLLKLTTDGMFGVRVGSTVNFHTKGDESSKKNSLTSLTGMWIVAKAEMTFVFQGQSKKFITAASLTRPWSERVTTMPEYATINGNIFA
jgi:hypothetical protein